MRNTFLLLILLSCTKVVVQGQSSVVLAIDSETGKSITESSRVSGFDDLRGLRQRHLRKGYLAFSIDSTSSSRDTIFSWCYLGPQYAGILIALEGDTSGTGSDVLNLLEFSMMQEKILDDFDNSGYPFAKIENEVFVDTGVVHVRSKIEKGPLIEFDSVKLVGDAKLDYKFLQKTLGIFQGDLFDQRLVDEIGPKFNAFESLALEDIQIRFSDYQATILLKVKAKKTSSANGIVSLLPKQDAPGVLFNGLLDLEFNNLFGYDKVFSMYWKRLQQASQSLQLKYDHNHLLASRINVHLGLDLLKQDSSFVSVDRFVGISAHFLKRFIGGVKTNRRTSQRLRDEAEAANMALNTYSVFGEFKSSSWNDVSRPGVLVKMEAGVGNKDIEELVEVDLQNEVEFEGQIRVPIKKIGLAFVPKVHVGLVSNNQLYDQDRFRLGGLKSLRGFPEYSFFADKFATAQNDVRWYWSDGESYLLAFYDVGWLSSEGSGAQLASGIGAGLSFNVQSGVFSFVYSLGQSSDQSFALNLSQVHFGLVSKF